MKAKIKSNTRISVYGWDVVTCSKGEIVEGDLAEKAVKLKLADKLSQKEENKIVVEKPESDLKPDVTKPDSPEEKKGWFK